MRKRIMRILKEPTIFFLFIQPVAYALHFLSIYVKEQARDSSGSRDIGIVCIIGEQV